MIGIPSDAVLWCAVAEPAEMLSGGSTCSLVLFLVGLALWLLPGVAARWQLVRLEMEYMRIYRRQVNPTQPTLLDLMQRYPQRPWLWWRDAFVRSWQLRRVLGEPQATVELEEARHRVVVWRRVVIAIMIGGSLFPLAACLLPV